LHCGPRGSFDFGALARAADLLAVMIYDYAVDGTAPVAPESWVRTGLRRIRELVATEDLHKVLIGLPLYGRTDRSLFSGDNSVLWSHVVSGVMKGAAVERSDEGFVQSALSNRARLTQPSGRSGLVFYEDHRSLTARLRLLEEEGFGAVALWRIGGEDPRTWEVLRSWKERRLSPPER
jgi:spore germination protein